MKTLYFNEKDGNIYWDFTDYSNYIEPVYVEDTLSCFDVWLVPEFGGKPILDSHCNSLKDAVIQLEMVDSFGL